MADCNTGMSGDLDIVHTPIPTESMPAHVREWLHSVGYDAETLARNMFATRLYAHHFRPHPKGTLIAGEHFGTADHPLAGEPHVLVEKRDLGPGAVTQVGAMYLSNGLNLATALTPMGNIADFNYHSIGTGSVAAAATDYWLGTPTIGNSLTSPTQGTIKTGYMLGVQTPPTAAAATTFKTVATFTAGTTIACTEWCLSMANAALSLPVAQTETGTPTATAFPDTNGTPFLNSGNKMAGWVIEIGGPINTPTTTVFGMVAVHASNTGTNLQLTAPGWQQLSVTGAAATTPSPSSAYSLYPAMLDRKQFAVINLSVNDTLATTYTNAISINT